MVLPLEFYIRSDVVQIARELIGKFLFTQFPGEPMTGGIIIETEAYAGPEDRASHAYNNRRTARTEPMFSQGGSTYVYLCYGIHSLLNIVTNIKGVPHAVLIRSICPTDGIETMLKRRNKNISKADPSLASGPGSTAQALGITLKHNNLTLDQPPIWIEDQGMRIPDNEILSGPRIGIAYAKEHALLPWRFWTESIILEKALSKPLLK